MLGISPSPFQSFNPDVYSSEPFAFRGILQSNFCRGVTLPVFILYEEIAGETGIFFVPNY
jgi:hypothetical protein